MTDHALQNALTAYFNHPRPFSFVARMVRIVAWAESVGIAYKCWHGRPLLGIALALVTWLCLQFVAFVLTAITFAPRGKVCISADRDR